MRPASLRYTPGVELVATLLTDLPLDEAHFHGLLRDLATHALAGAIQPRGLSARHSYGDASVDLAPRDILVRVERASKAPVAALHELERQRFRPVHALSFESDGSADAREDAWALVHLYAEQLRGWVLTRYLDYDTAAARGAEAGSMLKVPLAGEAQAGKAVLLAASALDLLAP